MSRESLVSLVKRLPDWIAVAFWLFLAGVRLAQVWQERSLVLALLVVQAVLVHQSQVKVLKDMSREPE